MMRRFAAWRYRNAVLYSLEIIFSHTTASNVRQVLKICFKDKLNEAIELLRIKGIAPGSSAAYLSTLMVPFLMATISTDHRDLTYYALSTGNEAEPIAANFFGMIRASRKLAGDRASDELYFNLLGALQGFETNELEKFVSQQLQIRT